MIGAFVIAFREVIEAGLIIGIVLAATRGIAGRGRWIALGVVGGLAGAALVALFAEKISDAFEGAGQDILNAAVLIVAVLMLIWHNTWMAKHGRELAGELRAAGEAVRTGQSTAAGLALVVGAAILREGAELVLFLYGLVASGTSGPDIQFGALAGVAVGAATSSVSYFGLAAIPTRYVFSVTSAPHRPARGRPGRPGGAVPHQCGPDHRARPAPVEHLRRPAGGQPRRPRAPRPRGLHRPPERHAGAGLSRHHPGHGRR